jgi:hypothetical protein
MTTASSHTSSPKLPVGLIVAVAAVAWILLAVGFQAIPEQAFASYLMAFLFFLGVSLGSMALLMMQYLTGGCWGLVLRRPAEAAAMSLMVLIPLFVPIALGATHVYPWADAAKVAADNVLQHRAGYLNFGAWIVRAAVYLAVWMSLILILRHRSLAHDASGSPTVYAGLKTVSAAGLVIYVVSMSLAGVDWVMSRDAHWYSTIFGFLLVVGQALSALAVLVLVLMLLSHRDDLQKALQPNVLNDLGNLFLTLVILWAYMSLCQFLVSWMGNVALDAAWYVPRVHGGLGFIAVLLIVCHFFVPFLLLLSRDAKRKTGFLLRIAIFIIVMRWLDLFWIVRPTGQSPADPTTGFLNLSDIVRYTDVIAPIAVGGFWLVVFQWQLARSPLLPQRDPAVTEMLKHGEHAAHIV